MPDEYTDLPWGESADESLDGKERSRKESDTIEWMEDRRLIGQRFVEASPGYDLISKAIDGIFAQESQSSSSYAPVNTSRLSNTSVNLIAKTSEDITALMTDTRVFFNYSSNNPKYQPQARLANMQAEDWYSSRCIDLRIADGIRYYTVAGSAFYHLFYDQRLNDMNVEAMDPRAVFPIEPNSWHTVQDAYGVILRHARTPHWVEMMYHRKVKADIGDPGIFGWLKGIFTPGRAKISGPLARRDRTAVDAIPANPTVFVNTGYLDDRRVNEKDKPVYMGKWKDGQPTSRFSYVVQPDAPLYPFKRMIIWTSDTILYDGPSPYWHAKFPVIKLTLNPGVGKAWLGKAPLWDVMPLNQSMNKLLRVIDDHAAKVAQPSVIADRNVSRGELNKFNSRVAGSVIRTNMAAGKGINVVEVPPLDQSLWQHVNWLEQMCQKLSGTFDPSQLANLAQVPSDDTIDTLMKTMTQGVQLRSRVLEGFMKEFAEMYLYCAAEWDTLPKRLAKFGPNALTNEDQDWMPKTFIPDNVPDGEPGDIASMANAAELENGVPEYNRAKLMLQGFSYKFKERSLLNSAANQDRMEDALLAKMGYLSWFTFMKNLGKENLYDANLKVPDDELGRLQLQQQMGIGMVANAQGRKATDQAPPQLSAQPGGDVTLQTS